MFSGVDADVIFFGHEHVPCEIHGRTKYVDVGSLGCNGSASAKGIVLTVTPSGYRYERVETPYPKEVLLKALQTGKIPNEEFIRVNYFGVDAPEAKNIL